MTAYINKLKDKDGNQQLPVTHERAVRDDNGTTLESKLQTIEGSILPEKPASTGTTGDYPYNGMGRVVLDKNMVSGVNTLTQSMMSATNTVYVIQYDYVLGADITVPANCVLEFDGGSISGNHSVTGIILNDVVKPDWFGAVKDGTTDCSYAVQNALNVCKVGGTVLFSNGSYAFRNATIRRSCTIKGSRESILIGQRLTEGLSGLDYLFKSDEVDEIYLEGFKVTAVSPIQQESRTNPSNPLFYFNYGKKVILDNVFFDSVKPRRAEAVPYYTDGVVLFSIVDFDDAVVTNCEFKDCAWGWSSEEQSLSLGGEVGIILPIQKQQKDINVVYTNNHAYNTTLGGYTILTCHCGSVLFDNNLIENINFADGPASELYGGGSLLNLFGSVINTVTNNTIRDCVSKHVFDFCEGGGEYSDKIYVSNNKVDCYNSIMVGTTSRVAEIKDNNFRGFSLVMFNGYSSDTLGVYPVGELVIIENNLIDCDYYDTNYKAANGKHGIGVGVENYFSKNISIRHNTIKYTYNADLPGDVLRRRKVINVINCKNLKVEDNYIYGTLPPNRHTSFPTYLYITTVKLKGYTYNDNPNVIEQVIITGNVIKTSNSSNYCVYAELDEEGTVEQLDHFEFMDIKNLILHSSDDTGDSDTSANFIICYDNVGIKRADVGKRYFKDNIFSGYEKGDSEPETTKCHISCIQKGHELIDSDVRVAQSDTCIPDYDSVSDLGATPRIGAVVSFGDTNWQVLKDLVTLTADMGPGNSGTIGEISVFNGIAWRRCPDSRNNFITLNNLANKFMLAGDDFVDLGLPSGTLWAKANIGAANQEDYGLYFYWGTVEGHAKGSGYDFSQTNYNSTSGAALNSDIPVGNNYDMARSNYGSTAKLPTRTQFDELVANCDIEWTTINGVTGKRFTSNINGNSIFFPASGRAEGTVILSEGNLGYYWACNIHSNANSAYCMMFSQSSTYPHTDGYRYIGFNVRAVI